MLWLGWSGGCLWAFDTRLFLSPLWLGVQNAAVWAHQDWPCLAVSVLTRVPVGWPLSEHVCSSTYLAAQNSFLSDIRYHAGQHRAEYAGFWPFPAVGHTPPFSGRFFFVWSEPPVAGWHCFAALHGSYSAAVWVALATWQLATGPWENVFDVAQRVCCGFPFRWFIYCIPLAHLIYHRRC